MKVILKNIAKKSGVSIATASRILKRTKTNYTDKELKVIQIAQNLGYPYIAYKKHSKKTHKIAIILKMGIGEFYPSLLNGFIESSYKSNYQFSMSMIDTNKKTDPTDEIIEMKPEQRREIVRGKTLGYLFFEPSTRTRLSFQSAMAQIGGTSFGIADATSSSIQKGESLADTVRIMAGYTDAIVLRHSLDGSSKFAAEVSDKPLINAGSGTEEHPTQAIQDLYTIQKELGKIDGKKIGIVGDLKYGRTVYSLLYGLSNYDVKVHLISPESLKVRSDSTYNLKENLSFVEIFLGVE